MRAVLITIDGMDNKAIPVRVKGDCREKPVVGQKFSIFGERIYIENGKQKVSEGPFFTNEVWNVQPEKAASMHSYGTDTSVLFNARGAKYKLYFKK